MSKAQPSMPLNVPDPNLKVEGSRGEILKVAAELFATHGYSKVSIRDIARTASVSVSTVMYHAGSKENLLEHCLDATFSADKGLVELIEYMGNIKVTTSEEFFALYDRFIELSIAQVAKYPMTCRLWWRLLLDHETLFHSLEEKFHRQLFISCNRFLKDAQQAGLIRDDSVDLSFFLASLDATIDGFFVGGHIKADGTRTSPGGVEGLQEFVRWLKQFGRLVLAKS